VLAIRTDSRPVVAWEEAGNIYVKRWDGSTWVSVGSVLDMSVGNRALHPDLDLRTDNNPVVAWQEELASSFDIIVKRWTGSTWVTVGSQVDRTIPNQARRPSIVLSSTNYPVVSWNEYDGTSESVFVRRF
jgi:hypothetical protein